MTSTFFPPSTNDTSQNTSPTQRRIPGMCKGALFSDDLDIVPRFKHRVICYLISHAVACHLPQVRDSILRSLKDAPNVSKASMLIPVFREVFETSQGVTIPATVDQGFLVALVRAFDKNAARSLNDEEALWKIFTEVLRACLTNGSCLMVPGPRPF